MSAPLGRAPSLTARSSFRKTEGKSSSLTGLKRKRAAWKARKSSLPQAIGLTYCAFFHLRIDTPPRIRYNKEAVRGVAHPVERVVWDHEARSSSLRTSTILRKPKRYLGKEPRGWRGSLVFCEVKKSRNSKCLRLEGSNFR